MSKSQKMSSNISPRTELWTLQEVETTLDVRPIYAQEQGQTIRGISFDTRTLSPGDLFIALKGEGTHDGHAFIQEAAQKGAAAIITSTPLKAPLEVPVFQVPDTMHALEKLGKAGRRRAAGAHRIGITGSVGKTTVKEGLKRVLSHLSPHTFASQGNFNNHMGVPLSLACMPKDTVFGIFEMGMDHPGEIRNLTQQVNPQIGVVTAVAPSHIGFFDSIEGIAHAKAEIFEGVAEGGWAIINRDLDTYPILAAAAQKQHLRMLTFGAHTEANVKLQEYTLRQEGAACKIQIGMKSFVGDFTFPGYHFLQNVLCIAAIVHASDLSVQEALNTLRHFTPLPGRGAQHYIAWHGKTLHIIDESYNANPTSMRAALCVLGGINPTPPGRRIAILGDMFELGTHTEKEHLALKGLLEEQKIDRLITCGPWMQKLHHNLDPKQQGGSYEDVDRLLDSLMFGLMDNDVILIKGSFGNQLGCIVKRLLENKSAITIS
jgi:UDP-N-acetylmuramoyl-tripeptide--D-alanyl-D-alanine ligase